VYAKTELGRQKQMREINTRPVNLNNSTVPNKPRLGERFTPFRKLRDIYWPDVVGRRKDLFDGQKRLYERLVRHAGDKATCWPSFGLLAEELGKSEKTIRKDARVLSDCGRITWKHRDGRRSNTYEFLWVAPFDAEFERKWGAAQVTNGREPVAAFERKNENKVSGTRGAANSVTTEFGSEKPSSSSELTADERRAQPNPATHDDDETLERKKGGEKQCPVPDTVSSSSMLPEPRPKTEDKDASFQKFKKLYPAHRFDEAKARAIFEGFPLPTRWRAVERLEKVYLKSERWQDQAGKWIPFASNFLKGFAFDSDPPPVFQPNGRSEAAMRLHDEANRIIAAAKQAEKSGKARQI
jgi:Helix-turn-helix domain